MAVSYISHEILLPFYRRVILFLNMLHINVRELPNYSAVTSNYINNSNITRRTKLIK